MANDIKKQIIDWFNSPQDYDQGLELLQRVSRRYRIIAKLIKRGETKTSFEKLVYELNKVAGLKKIPVPKAKLESGIVKGTLPPFATEQKPAANVSKPKKEIPAKKETFSLIGKTDISTLPPLVQRLVRENSSLYMQRGKKHKALTNLPDDNSKETQDKRIELMTVIEKMTVRLEVLFNAWEAYKKNGTEPDPEALWAQINNQDQSGADNKIPTSIEELKNLKKNIQSSITKDRNILLYGSKTKPKDGKEIQMQAGSKKTKLEKRIAKKESEIKALDEQIAELG